MQLLPLRVDAGRRMPVRVGDEQQALDPLMGVEAGPPRAHLDEPRPDLLGPCVDRNRSSRDRAVAIGALELVAR
jgi:hypothetical protein